MTGIAAPAADNPDLDDNYRMRLLAYEAGKQAKAAGRREWGEVFFEEQFAAWMAGWNGDPLED